MGYSKTSMDHAPAGRSHALGSAAWAGLGLLTATLAACSAWHPVTREAIDNETRLHVVESAVSGARIREGFPRCVDSEVPEGALRVEGFLEQGMSRCTDAGCAEANPCCNQCSKEPLLAPDDRRKKPVAIVLDGLASKLFDGGSLNECWAHAWWEGLGRLRLRMTYHPDRPRAERVVELCRLPDAE